MKSRYFRPVALHGTGMGANLDVMTLTGYHGAGSRSRGLWGEVYAGRGYPIIPGVKARGCVSWRTVGKGCACKPQCASFDLRSKGTTKAKALASCEKKCVTKKRPKRRGRK